MDELAEANHTDEGSNDDSSEDDDHDTSIVPTVQKVG